MNHIYIVNCSLPYLFEGVEGCQLMNCNGRISLARRLMNRFGRESVVPENMSSYDRLKDADCVIFFADTTRFLLRCRHIEEVVPQTAVLHLYLWNPASYYDEWISDVGSRWHVWTFSEEESLRHGMLYGETFYNKDLAFASSVDTDLFFVGLDKGRKFILTQLAQSAKAQGLTADIRIVDTIRSRFSRAYSPRMGYDDVRKHIASSRTIIDIVQKGQTGLTQRVVESLFFRKKLITNNQRITKAPFYSRSNIFLLGVDRMEDLGEFVRSPYEVSEFDADHYDVRKWMERMLNTREFNGQ